MYVCVCVHASVYIYIYIYIYIYVCAQVSSSILESVIIYPVAYLEGDTYLGTWWALYLGHYRHMASYGPHNAKMNLKL